VQIYNEDVERLTPVYLKHGLKPPNKMTAAEYAELPELPPGRMWLPGEIRTT
jgi:hypothetical protein